MALVSLLHTTLSLCVRPVPLHYYCVQALEKTFLDDDVKVPSQNGMQER